MADEFNNFENTFDDQEVTFEEEKIIIRIDKRNARKSISYIEGWNLELDELKKHLKSLKTKLGCNGTVKNKKVNGNDTIIFQLQGDKRNELLEYLTKQGINESNITIIG